MMRYDDIWREVNNVVRLLDTRIVKHFDVWLCFVPVNSKITATASYDASRDIFDEVFDDEAS